MSLLPTRVCICEQLRPWRSLCRKREYNVLRKWLITLHITVAGKIQYFSEKAVFRIRHIFRKSSHFASFSWLSKNVRLKHNTWLSQSFVKRTTYLFSIQLFKYCISMVLLFFLQLSIVSITVRSNYLITPAWLVFLQQNNQVERENMAHPQSRKKSKSIDEVQNFD
jgi:hypothetical protein